MPCPAPTQRDASAGIAAQPRKGKGERPSGRARAWLGDARKRPIAARQAGSSLHYRMM